MNKKIKILSLLLLLSFTSQAQEFWENNENDGDPYDDLFDSGYGKDPKTVPSDYVINCQGQGRKSVPACFAIHAALISDYIANYGDGTTTRATVRTALETSSAGNQITSSQGTWIEYYRSSDGKWIKNTQGAKSYNDMTDQEEALQCPPAGFPDWDINGMVDGVHLCFSAADLNTRDSCPDSTNDDSYILPVYGTPHNNVCQQKPDGSRCEYDLSENGDYYQSDFENGCYSSYNLNPYDDSQTNPPVSSDIGTCEAIGGTVQACIESPDNVCDSQGNNCAEGCGFVQWGAGDEVFVCLSGDTDNDTLADYLDPDIDGDGIANDLDIDKDGDGLDDVTYGKNNGEGISIDTGNMEDLLASGNGIAADSNAKLGSIEGGLGNANGWLERATIAIEEMNENSKTSGTMPTLSIEQDVVITNQSALDKIKASPVVLALESMGNFINVATGVCPIFSVDLPSPINVIAGTTIHCELMASVDTYLSGIMIALYIFTGFRIFTSA